MTSSDFLKLTNSKSMRRRLTPILLVALAAAVALAQEGRSQADAPSVDRLRAHITYLASEKLAGRRTGSSGANLAAEYIAREFSRYGLRRTNGYDTAGMSRLEADSPSRYQQGFPYVASVELGGHNLFYVNPGRADDMTQFRTGEDWMPLGFSSNASIKKGQTIFVGYGITSAELKYDDYAVSDAKGRVAIAFAGTPDGDNPHGQFGRLGEIRFKVAAARAAGAKALLIIANEEKFKDDRLVRLTYDNAGEAGLPVMVISRQFAKKLLRMPNPEMTLTEFERLAADGRLVNTKPETRQPINGYTVDISIDVVRRESPSYNVIGILPGSDPKLKDEAIIIGAHYDHLGYGGEGSLAPREGEIHHGADDNASGVAGMLELARIFSSQDARPKRTLIFMAFSGEEEGLLGSNYYVNHPIVPMAQTVAMINMDMIGRLSGEKLIVGGVGTAAEWRAEIENANVLPRAKVAAANVGSGQTVNLSIAMPAGSDHGTPVNLDSAKFQLTLNEDGYGPSDHSSFYAKQVPVLFFWTGTHNDYHKPSDTADKINYEGEAQILSFVAGIIRDIDRNDKRPTYSVAKSEATGRSMGFRVYLGTIPNYADSNDGLLLDGVRDDSPAAKAGLKAGDRIVKMAGREVKNVYDYTYALGEMKAGQQYEVAVKRGSETVSLKITPAARK